MAINDNFEVKITSVYQGDVQMNVLHYQQTTGTGGITEVVGKLMAGVKGIVTNVLAQAQVEGVTYQSIRIQQVGVPNPIIQKDAITDVGVVTDDGLPGQDAVLFVKRCNTGGRANVGKFYLGGVSDEWAEGGNVDVDQAELVAVATVLKTNVTNTGVTFAPIIWHRTPQTAEFITICNVRRQISRQNRRHLPVY